MKYATAVQPRKGAKKPMRPMTVASFQRARKTCGSDSVPARKVSTIAPAPARNVIHGCCAPRKALPTLAPMMSWATVPTTISERAVEMRSLMAMRTAMSARPTQMAARNQVSAMRPSHEIRFQMDMKKLRHRTRDLPMQELSVQLDGTVQANSIAFCRLFLAAIIVSCSRLSQEYNLSLAKAWYVFMAALTTAFVRPLYSQDK